MYDSPMVPTMMRYAVGKPVWAMTRELLIEINSITDAPRHNMCVARAIVLTHVIIPGAGMPKYKYVQ